MRCGFTLAFLLAASATASSAAFGQTSEADRLQACIDKIDRDAAEAYQDGLTWLATGNRPAARQCTAMALIALGQEAEGAARLEALANAPDGGSLEQRSVYLAQSGNAWLLARMPDAAVVTLTNALKLRPRDADLRKDRARAYMMLKKWPEAGKDLDVAIELSPGDAEGMRLRALTLLKMERYRDAWSDVEAALRQAPKDVDAAVLRGDIREAMRAKGMPDPAALDDTPRDQSPVVVGN
jgi:regulator of sirC expression with transglutaminase-like and TPR domain